MATNFSLKGGAELAQQLKGLPDAVSIIAVRRAGLAAAKPIQDAARRYAPDPSRPSYYTDKEGRQRIRERTGRLQLHLNRGSRYIQKTQTVRVFVGLIRMHPKKAEKLGLTSIRKRDRKGRFLPERKWRTVVNDAWYGKFPDQGTRFQPAQHFLSRAIKENAQAFLDAYIPMIQGEIKKAAKAARRTKQ